jgi:hypothetical protein
MKRTEEDFERELSERFPNEPEKIRIHDRVAAVEKMLKDRQHGKRFNDDENESPMDDERDRVVRDITHRRLLKLHEENEAAERAAEITRAEMEDYEYEQMQKELDEELEDADNQMSDDEIVETLQEEFPEINLANEETRQALSNMVGVEVASGADASDYRVYKKAAQHFLNRPPYASRREDPLNSIILQNERRTAVDNDYYNRGLNPSGIDHEPETYEEKQGHFIAKHPDIVEDQEALLDAKEMIDEEQLKTAIETGVPRNDYGLYESVGEAARQRAAIREIKRSRGQIEED